MIFWIAQPEVVLAMGAVLILAVDAFARGRGRYMVSWVACLSFLGALLLLINPVHIPAPDALSASLNRGPLGEVFVIFIALAALGAVLLVIDYFRDDPSRAGCVASLFVFSVLGMFVMAGAQTLLVLFMGLELMTFPVYLAVASGHWDGRKGDKGDQASVSLEASVKYFVMGGVASAIFLFGMSLIFAQVGSLGFADIWMGISQGGLWDLVVPGSALVAVAVFFKLSIFPLHFWTPDAYEGAPVPVTAFMATAVKTAAFIFFFKVLFVIVYMFPDRWFTWMAVVSIATMIWGNWVALHQENLNRLMAYSSIAHVGYMLIAVSLLSYTGDGTWDGPLASLVLYLAGYVAMTLGVFAVLSACRLRTLSDIRGLWQRTPFAAAVLTLFLLSLTGIPPTAGFLGKFYIFLDALKEGHVGLAIAGALNSALAAFYYLKIVRAIYLEEGQSVSPIRLAPASTFVMIGCAVAVLSIGLWPAFRDFLDQLIA